jgi:glycosyltransferase involved in cell wall biosynthesis
MDRAVFLDASPLASRPLTGIGRYAARLALALSRQRRVRFFTGDYEVIAPLQLSWDQDQDLARWARAVWKGRRIPLEAPDDSTGVYPGPRDSTRRFPCEVGILYDFTPLILPGTHASKTKLTFSRFFAEGLLANDHVVAISRATEADSLWLSDLPRERVAVEYPGPSLCVEKHLDSTVVRRDEKLILSVSTLEPRKNAAFLFDWFARTEALPADAELWWVGPIGWLTSRRTLKRYQRASTRRIRFLGMVSDSTLCRLYRQAGLTIYPSLYEGFGFPVLDSLRHGTPVLTSQNSSLCEFTVPGVTFFDPCDAATLDKAWCRFRYAEPIDLEALEKAYSWNRVARRVHEMHHQDRVPEPGAFHAPYYRV